LVAVAAVIGGIQALSFVGEQLGLCGALWDTIGSFDANFNEIGSVLPCLALEQRMQPRRECRCAALRSGDALGRCVGHVPVGRLRQRRPQLRRCRG
jgi:hypothetical protein